MIHFKSPVFFCLLFFLFDVSPGYMICMSDA